MKSPEEQRLLREARSLLQRASQPHATLETRRETLQRLMGFTHSNSAELKLFAAENMERFFAELADESLVDCVYDLCEDTDMRVRIQGYARLVGLSREAPKWNRRNTDVLVQLLQSDSQTEISHIRAALESHIQLDADAAIGVLCDHCFCEPGISGEELDDKERLRKLVVLFLLRKETQKLLLAQCSASGACESVFRDGLIKSVSCATVPEISRIVTELLLPLPSYSARSQVSEALLTQLIEKAKELVPTPTLASRTDLINLDELEPLLITMELLAVEKRLANPVPLGLFYIQRLINKVPANRVTRESRLIVIQHLVSVLAVCKTDVSSPTPPELGDAVLLRTSVVNACTDVLETLNSTDPSVIASWTAAVAFMKVCVERMSNEPWRPNESLVRAVRQTTIRSVNAPQGLADIVKQLKEVAENIAPAASTASHVSLKRKSYSEASDGPRTSRKEGPTSLADQRCSQTAINAVDGSRGSKLLNRVGGDVSSGERRELTLLRRLSHGSNNGSVQRGSQPSQAHTDSRTANPSTSTGLPMLSIRGAASVQHRSEDAQFPTESPQSSSTRPSPRPQSTLLARLSQGTTLAQGPQKHGGRKHQT